MCELVDRLCADHKNMIIVLDFISDGLDKSGYTRRPVFGLLSEAMRYIVEYADDVHHPQEEILFHQLCTITSQLDDVVVTLAEEHDHLYECGNKLRDDIDALENGRHPITDQQVRFSRDYTFLQRRHMQLEEDSIFPAAENLFATQDWESIHSSYLMQDDPLFGEQVEVEYLSLRNHLDGATPNGSNAVN